MRKALSRATAALDRQDFESAIRSANEALALDPILTEALDLRRRAQAAIEKQRREKERPPRQPAPAGRSGRGTAPDHTSTDGRRRVPLPVVLIVLTATAAALTFALSSFSQSPADVAIPEAPKASDGVAASPAQTAVGRGNTLGFDCANAAAGGGMVPLQPAPRRAGIGGSHCGGRPP